MKHLIALVLPVLLVGWFASCSYNPDMKKKTIGNKFHISIPAYVSETDQLSSEAIFQFRNRFRTIYGLVNEKYKNPEESLSALVYRTTAELAMIIDSAEVSTPYDTEINGLPVVASDIIGRIDNERVYYRVFGYDAGKQYYELVMWTLEKRRDKYYNEMDAVAQSFSLVKP